MQVVHGAGAVLYPVLQQARPVHDPRKAIREHAQRGGDPGQEEHGRDGRLNQVNDVHGSSAVAFRLLCGSQMRE